MPMRKRGTNKRLSEKSSHRSTVDCQRWFEAGALLLPADKPAFLRSAEPLGLCTRLAEGKKGRLWLQQHPLGEGALAALSRNRSTSNNRHVIRRSTNGATSSVLTYHSGANR